MLSNCCTVVSKINLVLCVGAMYRVTIITRHLWCVVSPPMGRFQSAEMAGPF